MFEKLDDFAMEWLETAKSGLAHVAEFMEAVAEIVFNLFWAIVALLMMAFTFPFWLIGKARDKHKMTLGESQPAVSAVIEPLWSELEFPCPVCEEIGKHAPNCALDRREAKMPIGLCSHGVDFGNQACSVCDPNNPVFR